MVLSQNHVLDTLYRIAFPLGLLAHTIHLSSLCFSLVLRIKGKGLGEVDVGWVDRFCLEIQFVDDVVKDEQRAGQIHGEEAPGSWSAVCVECKVELAAHDEEDTQNGEVLDVWGEG